jgi:hypothetical protein
MGHTIFIEDAAETKNRLINNLVVNTRASHSLLDTDTTPGGFWITHPDNIVEGNHVAGSEKYGFWYDLQVHSTGPSFSSKICPENAQMGTFFNNTAHTVGRYGLRIFHVHKPRERPCESVSSSNPEIPAHYKSYTGFKNGRAGVMGLSLGAIVLEDIRVADNKDVGIQFDWVSTSDSEANYMLGGVVVGTSGQGGSGTPHGIISPQTEGWSIRGAHFYSFPTGAAIGQCSHCEICGLLDSDADTVFTEDLKFDDATVPRRIAWRPSNEKGIYHDNDGTLTGMGEHSWATSNWKHNEWADSTACKNDADTLAKFDGFICDNTVTVRKIWFHAPSGNISGKPLNLWQWDTNVSGMNIDEKWNFQATDENATPIEFRSAANPANHWLAPFVIPKNGRRTFYGRFGGGGYDFTSLTLERNNALWDSDDGELVFIISFYAIREAIYFDENGSTRHDNETYFTGTSQPCDNVVYNDTFNETQPKNFTVKFNHNNPNMRTCKMTGVQCLNNCWD